MNDPTRTCELVLGKPKPLCYTLRACEPMFRLFLGSSAVEHPTVNRMVAGSNPARGASKINYLIGAREGRVFNGVTCRVTLEFRPGASLSRQEGAPFRRPNKLALSLS